jgi:hypothetical protein
MSSPLAERFRDYAPQHDVPLAGYAGAMGLFGLTLGGVLLSMSRTGRWQSGWADLVLLGVGTHKLARLITKDAVTAPLRAPFTRRQETEGAGEVHDEPRDDSALAQLVTCPFCAGPWLGTGLGAALAWRPEPTRFVLRLLTAVTIADFLHLGYARLNESRKTLQAERRLREGS